MTNTPHTGAYPLAPVTFNDDKSIINFKNLHYSLRACNSLIIKCGVNTSDQNGSPINPMIERTRLGSLENACKLDSVALRRGN